MKISKLRLYTLLTLSIMQAGSCLNASYDSLFALPNNQKTLIGALSLGTLTLIYYLYQKSIHRAAALTVANLAIDNLNTNLEQANAILKNLIVELRTLKNFTDKKDAAKRAIQKIQKIPALTNDDLINIVKNKLAPILKNNFQPMIIVEIMYEFTQKPL